MLYDNAQLALSYLHAYLLTREVAFRDVAVHTLDFVARELTHPQGGFFSSLDADIAVYYYLVIVREACFRDPTGQPAIALSAATRTVCVALVVLILALGVAPSWLLGNLSSSIASMNTPRAQSATVRTVEVPPAVVTFGK